jgi:hypothetical protein
MISNPDALLPSAKEVMQKIALAEAEEAEKHARMLLRRKPKKGPHRSTQQTLGDFRGGGDPAGDGNHRTRDDESADRG